MKLHKFLMAVAIVTGTAVISGCDDDFDRPPVIVPEATIETNTTILDLKEQYWQGTSDDFMTSIGETPDGERVIIGGRVISSDKEGNIYQRIIIEDETSAIPIRIYSSDLYESYQYGQEVRIDVTGLLIGTYRGLMMIGVEYNGSVGGMGLSDFQERAQVNRLPDVSAITEYVTTIPDVASYKTDQTQLMTWQSRLITIENVEFVNGGREMFGTPGANNYTTRQLRDAEGNTLDISTSNKCDFVNLIMPSGKGTIHAVLSWFGSNWQLNFSDPKTDCEGFNWDTDSPSTPTEPVDPSDAESSISADFENNALPDGWVETVTSGNRNWQVKEFNSNYYVQCTAYKGTAGANGFESWLITAPVNFDAMTVKEMSFKTEIQYGGNSSNLQLFVMSSADPATAEKTELQFTQPVPTESGDATGYLFSGEISLEQFSGIGYIAWLYTASDPDDSRTYRLDDINIGLKPGTTPAVPTPGDALYTALGEDDSSTDWNLDSDTGVWSWKMYSQKYYLNATAYEKPDIIGLTVYATSPVIDLTGTTSAKLTFDHAAKFQTILRSLCTAVVREAGSNDWTALTIPVWPEAGSWTFVSSGEIDLSAYAGKKIQLGFKYGSSSSGADTWEIKNLKITE